MKYYRTILIGVMVLFVMACNLPISSSTPPVPKSSTPTSTLTPAFPPSPTFTTVPAVTSTPSEPQLTPNTNAVNCRLGPDVVYRVPGCDQFRADRSHRRKERGWQLVVCS